MIEQRLIVTPKYLLSCYEGEISGAVPFKKLRKNGALDIYLDEMAGLVELALYNSLENWRHRSPLNLYLSAVEIPVLEWKRQGLVAIILGAGGNSKLHPAQDFVYESFAKVIPPLQIGAGSWGEYQAMKRQKPPTIKRDNLPRLAIQVNPNSGFQAVDDRR